MKKIDLHIHTIPTISDSHFEFSLDVLIGYTKTAALDAIAVTNHNIFDIDQFRKIRSALSAKVFPGIEVNLEGGHILLISDGADLENFAAKCLNLNVKIKLPSDTISYEELIDCFGLLDNYLIIPHYDKRPVISQTTIDKFGATITAGEVNSPKKFIYSKKNSKDLVPVYFSDCRIATTLNEFPTRQTYISCGELSLNAIKNCLQDKGKVSLTSREGHSLFCVLPNGLEISTGLNVVIGERSSGKSYTLRKISEHNENVKYIEQFELVERNEEKDAQKFNELLSRNHSLLSQEFLKEFKVVVEDVLDVNIEENEKRLSQYLDTLKAYASEIERHDAFSKATLFTETPFSVTDNVLLRDLIKSTQNLIENIEYRSIIEKHISIESLKKLIVDLMVTYSLKEEDRLKKNWINDLIRNIQDKLHSKSASTKIEDADLYRIAMDIEKKDKFEKIVDSLRSSGTIEEMNIQGFKVVASVSNFTNAEDLKSVFHRKTSLKAAYNQYGNPYEFLKALKSNEEIPKEDVHKFFAKINYKILNKDGFEVSGGERSEFNLLQTINDARMYDILLIDEPESSFDNIFLRSEVNCLIKDLSKTMPVVLVTHNNTVGMSIKPDYIIHTKKENKDGKIIYTVFGGFPTDKQLVSIDGNQAPSYEVTLSCLEAGKETYDERRRLYENLEN